MTSQILLEHLTQLEANIGTLRPLPLTRKGHPRRDGLRANKRTQEVVRCVIGMVEHAVSDTARLFPTSHPTLEDCEKLVNEWDETFRTVSALGQKTPKTTAQTPVDADRLSGKDEQEEEEDDDDDDDDTEEDTASLTEEVDDPDVAKKKDVVRRLSRIKKAASERDKFQCVVTGLGNATRAKRTLSPTLYAQWIDNRRAALGPRWFDSCRIAHLLPFYLTPASFPDIYVFLERISGIGLEKYKKDGTDQVQNVMTLSSVVHAMMSRFEMGFRPDPEDPLHYFVECHESAMSGGFPVDFTFFSDSDHEPPDPNLMRLLYSVYRISHASTAAESLLLPALRMDEESMEGLRALDETREGIDGADALIWRLDEYKGKHQQHVH